MNTEKGAHGITAGEPEARGKMGVKQGMTAIVMVSLSRWRNLVVFIREHRNTVSTADSRTYAHRSAGKKIGSSACGLSR